MVHTAAAQCNSTAWGNDNGLQYPGESQRHTAPHVIHPSELGAHYDPRTRTTSVRVVADPEIIGIRVVTHNPSDVRQYEQVAGFLNKPDKNTPDVFHATFEQMPPGTYYRLEIYRKNERGCTVHYSHDPFAIATTPPSWDAASITPMRKVMETFGCAGDSNSTLLKRVYAQYKLFERRCCDERVQPVLNPGYSVVVDQSALFDKQLTKIPQPHPLKHCEFIKFHPWHSSAIPEEHISPEFKQYRGTIEILGDPKVRAYLKRFGNALELFPLTPTLPDPTLVALGLTDAWGYMPWSLLALNGNYFSERDPLKQITTLQKIIAACKGDGLNFYVDLVPFHTHVPQAHVGLYALRPEYYLRHNGEYKDITGCRNTLNINDPHTKALILWQSELWSSWYGAGRRIDQAAVAHSDVTLDPHSGEPHVNFRPDHPFAKELYAKGPCITEPGHGRGFFPRNTPAIPGVREKNFIPRDRNAAGPSAHPGNKLSDLAFTLSNFVGPHPTQNSRPWRANRGITVYPHDGMCPFDTAQRWAAVLVAMKCKDNPAIKQPYLNWAKSTSSDDRACLVSAIHTAVQRDLPEDLFTLSAAVHRYYMGLLYLTPGPILSVFGDQLVRTQHGDPDGYNRREFITQLGWSAEPAHLPTTLQQEVAYTEGMVAELHTLRTRWAPHFRNTRVIDGKIPSGFDGTVTPALTWYGKDGAEISQNIWEKGNGHARGFLGQRIILNRQGQPADALFLAFRETLGGHFQLPALPGGKRFWRRCLETSAPHPDFKDKQLLNPGDRYHCGHAPRVIAFEAVSVE